MDSGLAAPGNKLSSPLLVLRTGAKPKSYRFKYRFNEAKAIRLQHEQKQLASLGYSVGLRPH
jgi:hypothetical protein